jgi:hypothetical protein
MQTIRTIFKEIENECLAKFKSKLVSGISSDEELMIKELLGKLKKTAKTNVFNQCKELCSEHLEKLCEEILEKVKKRLYPTYQKMKEDLVEMISGIPKEITECPGFSDVKADTIFSKLLTSIELFFEQADTNHSNEVKLLTQKLKSLENENYTRKSDALKDKEIFAHKLQQSEEELNKLRTKGVLLEERNKVLTTDMERHESKMQKELVEYKSRVQELEQALRHTQTGCDKEMQALKDDTMKKDLEANKTIALHAQQLKFMQEKVTEYSNTITNKENEIAAITHKLQESESSVRLLQEDLRSKEKKLAQAASKANGSKTARGKGGDSLEVENAVLKKQLEIMQEQVNENKKVYSQLMEAINSNLSFSFCRRND